MAGQGTVGLGARYGCGHSTDFHRPAWRWGTLRGWAGHTEAVGEEEGFIND